MTRKRQSPEGLNERKADRPWPKERKRPEDRDELERAEPLQLKAQWEPLRLEAQREEQKTPFAE